MSEQVHIWNHTGATSFCQTCGETDVTVIACPGQRPGVSRIADLETEIADLKARVKEEQAVIRQIVALVPRDAEREDIFDAIERTVRERDNFEALAERRKEALKLADNWLPSVPKTRLGSLLTREEVIGITRAAIDMKPEEAQHG